MEARLSRRLSMHKERRPMACVVAPKIDSTHSVHIHIKVTRGVGLCGARFRRSRPWPAECGEADHNMAQTSSSSDDGSVSTSSESKRRRKRKLRRKEEKRERRGQRREKRVFKKESKRARHELRRQEKAQRRHRPAAAVGVSGAGMSGVDDSVGYSGIDVCFEARLRDEMLAEGDDGGFGWVEDMETAGQMSGDWFTGVANELEGLRRQRARDRERAAAERAHAVHKRRASTEAEQRQWQQAMLEEVEADAARREEVKRRRAAAAHVAAHHSYEAGWLALGKHEGSISLEDVPWPCEHPAAEGSSGDAGFAERIGRVVLPAGGSGMDVVTRRKALQVEQRRWHPDKFTSRWGGRLMESTREAVLERVKQVSQALNALISDETILGGDGPEAGPRPPSRHAAGR